MNVRNEILLRFKHYFPVNKKPLFCQLPIFESNRAPCAENRLVELPEWAADLGLGPRPGLQVPICCLVNPEKLEWARVDWWRAAYLLMISNAERLHESTEGPIHSYSSRLPDTLNPLWERAWVNRIFLFLRRWVAHVNNTNEVTLLGGLPRGVLHLTHDVDYVNKTLALRLKQIAFINYNILKCLLSGKFSTAASQFSRLFRFGLGSANYWQFPVIQDLEAEYHATSSWNFYGGVGGLKRSISELLLDPAYRVTDQKLVKQLKELQQKGNRIGLHQGFHSWRDSYRMKKEKCRLKLALGLAIDSCRQHWLRFSFKDTWRAQEEAGFLLDTTLGFNDRPGFRNSAALRVPAWIADDKRFSTTLNTLPMILMDSHLFDYGQLEVGARRQLIDYYLDEIAFVSGEATVIWHHRVFHSDYGWGDDYRYLLEGIKSRNLST
jgi:hypothetical protein